MTNPYSFCKLALVAGAIALAVYTSLWVSAIPVARKGIRGNVNTDWKAFNDVAEVQSYLGENVRIGSSVLEVSNFTIEHGLECAPLFDGVKRCSAPARSESWWIGAKWLVEFHFDGGHLAKILVKLGLTGP